VVKWHPVGVPGPPLFDLEGRGIVVTGGGGHLGRALVLGLAGLGAVVVACGRDAARLDAVIDAADGLPGHVHRLVADVSDETAVAATLERTRELAGATHGWVNNAFAGTSGPPSPVSAADAAATIASGLTDVVVVTDLVGRHMAANGGGSIVNIGSMYGVVSPDPRAYLEAPDFHSRPAYGAAKAGVVQLSRYTACQLGPAAVRVNCVSPGPFPGPAAQARTGFVAELAGRVPLGRIGEPHELVGPVAFLLSDAASYVTGHNLVVDGGWTAW
jgi:gluconate 5-dehydrogenase